MRESSHRNEGEFPLSEEAALTILLRLGETLIRPQVKEPDRDNLQHGTASSVAKEQDTPAPEIVPEIFIDLEALLRLSDEDTPMMALAESLPPLFGNDSLQLMFRGLFPADHHGKAGLRASYPRLTTTEIQVMRYVAQGLTQKEIAARLSSDTETVSPKTVNKHLENIYDKLKVDNKVEAALLASFMGYLDFDLLQLLILSSPGNARGFSAFQSLCMGLYNLEVAPEEERYRRLAMLGLLLMTVGLVAGRQLRDIANPTLRRRGGICELYTDGSIGPVFGSEHIGVARSLAVAPPQAERQGFTPGNLFVAHDLHPQQRLNRAAISEFTPNGEYVRTFCGGEEVGTRLIGTIRIAFHADGKLLVTSGWLTEGILAFAVREQKPQVTRFADGTFSTLCNGPQNLIYATRQEHRVSCVEAFDPTGRSQVIWEDAEPVPYEAIGATTREFYVAKRDVRASYLHVVDREGKFLRELSVPGYHWSPFVINTTGNLILPCRDSGDVKVISPQGKFQATFDLRGRLNPEAVVVSRTGGIWVGGRIVDVPEADTE